MTKLFQFQEWLKYLIIADNIYNVHSPFLYHFYENILKNAKKDTIYQSEVLPILKKLLSDRTYIQKQDLGTGKTVQKEQVAYVARTSSIRPKYGHILHQIVKHFNPQIIVELGTCFGISTRYLLYDFKGTHFYTVEGSFARHTIAKSHLDTTKVLLLHSAFEDALDTILDRHSTIDLVFIDGNHTFEATIEYFTQFLPFMHAQSILIFDDIHWSKGMHNAWKHICQHPKVTLTIDIFQLGICFFNPGLSKENRIIRY